MTDLIFWGTNYNEFLVEAFEKSPELVGKDDETGEYYVKYTKTPMKMNHAQEFMFLVRTTDKIVGYFARLSSIENMGNYEAVLVSAPKREIYDRIYPNAPYDSIDDEGNTITITPAEKFGVFLGEV